MAPTTTQTTVMAANTTSASTTLSTTGDPVGAPVDTIAARQQQQQEEEAVLKQYKAILAEHLSDPVRIKDALSTTTNHALWNALAALFHHDDDNDDHGYNNNNDRCLQSLLNAVHAQGAQQYPVPTTTNTTCRSSPKRVERVRDKIRPCPAHRSNFCDWIACRLACRYQDFEHVKRKLVTTLSADTVVVWRYNYDNDKADADSANDIMHMGYAYRPGALGVMEIQVVEPLAAWVFTSNSLHKHAQCTGRVTFKESKALYQACKTAILQHNDAIVTVQDRAMLQDVVGYYQAQRAANGNTEPLDLEELAKFQALLNERFFSTHSQAQAQ